MLASVAQVGWRQGLRCFALMDDLRRTFHVHEAHAHSQGLQTVAYSARGLHTALHASLSDSLKTHTSDKLSCRLVNIEVHAFEVLSTPAETAWCHLRQWLVWL
jgi:hypothetical protein